jgi:hypothetical protein
MVGAGPGQTHYKESGGGGQGGLRRMNQPFSQPAGQKLLPWLPASDNWRSPQAPGTGSDRSISRRLLLLWLESYCAAYVLHSNTTGQCGAAHAGCCSGTMSKGKAAVGALDHSSFPSLDDGAGDAGRSRSQQGGRKDCSAVKGIRPCCWTPLQSLPPASVALPPRHSAAAPPACLIHPHAGLCQPRLVSPRPPACSLCPRELDIRAFLDGPTATSRPLLLPKDPVVGAVYYSSAALARRRRSHRRSLMLAVPRPVRARAQPAVPCLSASLRLFFTLRLLF